MTTKLERAAMQKALEWFAWWRSGKALWTDAPCAAEDVLSALREALAEQAEQEPVGEMIDKAGYKGTAWYLEPPATGTKLYATPVRTKDLTDDEIEQLVEEKLDTWSSKNMMTDFARAVIAADREKNK